MTEAGRARCAFEARCTGMTVVRGRRRSHLDISPRQKVLRRSLLVSYRVLSWYGLESGQVDNMDFLHAGARQQVCSPESGTLGAHKPL